MSLDVLAHHLATKGRNGDSMLVHMTPGEVHGLHALALAHGGRLTINPETGLPEANFLKKLLPAIAGAALNFFAPGIGTAIGGALGLGGAAGSAIAVGGITGLATGSLQKGLMAGLGAYGGAGLTEGLAALGTQGAAAQLAEQGIAAGAQENARDALLARAAEQTVVPTGLDALKAGADAAMKNPGAFLKTAAKPLMYAAAPIMADAMVPTTTAMPTSKPGDTGYIRPFVYDPTTFGQGPQGLQALAPVAANQIKYGANGGIVALAEGGSVTRGPETMEDVRRSVGNRYAPVPVQADRMVATTTRMPGDTSTAEPMTAASQAAYDYLMGVGAYPTTQPGVAAAPATAPTDPFAHYRPVVVDAAPAAGPTTYDYLMGGGASGADAGVSGGFSSVGVTGAEAGSADSSMGSADSSVGVTGAEGASGDSGAAADGGSSAGDGSGVGDGTGGVYAQGGITALAAGGSRQYNLGSYSDGGRLLRGPGDGVSDSIPATIGKRQPARLADGEFVIPARIVSELGNGSTEAGARKLYAMMDRVQRARRKTTGKNRVAANTKAERLLPA